MDWNATLLRFTLFPGEAKQINPQEWWQQAVGDTPEEVSTKPKTSEMTMSGSLGDGKLILQIAPNRVDWVLSVLPLVADLNWPLRLGPLQPTFELFANLVDRWLQLDSCPVAGRVAFGAILDLDVDSKRRGYETLAGLLHHVEVDVESEDLQFQVNRPRPTQIGDLSVRINRLSRWSVAQLMEVQIGSQMIQVQPNPSELSVHLELDINTDQKYEGRFSQRILSDVFRVLRELAGEIAEKGDVL